MVVVWSGVDVLTNFLPVVRGVVVCVVTILYGVDVLSIGVEHAEQLPGHRHDGPLPRPELPN